MTSVLLALVVAAAGISGATGASTAPLGSSPTTPGVLAEKGLVDELIVGASEDGSPLIAWDTQSGQGFVLGANLATIEGTFHGPASSAVAVSPGGRRAYFTDQSRTVEIASPDGARSTLELGGEAGGMAWIDDRRLAVSPVNGEFLVDIWDVESGQRLQEIGAVPRLSEAPGYRPLRATDIAWDRNRRRLHTLDAFTGRYRVFDLSKPGAPRRNAPEVEAQIEDQARARYDEWIAAMDRQLAAQGEFQGSTIWRFSLGLDAHGTAWMVERCDTAGDQATAGTAHLLAVDPGGKQHRVAVETACCSLEAVPWRDLLVFSRPASSGRAGCFSSVPRPDFGEAQSTSWWLEATPLSVPRNPRSRQSELNPAVRVRFPSGTDVTRAFGRLDGVGPGSVLVCTGGADRPLDCEQLWIDPDAGAPPDLDLDRDLDEGPGRPVTGRITVGGRGASGAEIALVPADFRTTRLVTLPLSWPAESDQPVREVATDGEGHFNLPLLAPGEYRLLVSLPGGRVDQGTTFTVRAAGGSDRSGDPQPVQLGEIDFPAGLRVEVAVTDPDGEPLPGALAGAAQPLPDGEAAPGAMTLFSAETDEGGRAVLDGLAPDQSVVVTCRSPGHVLWRQRFDVPPSYVDCSLERLGRITGQVVDEDGEPVSDGRVTLAGGSGFDAGALETVVLDQDSEGRFRFDGLEPAGFRLEATSPGRGTKSLSLMLDAGEARDLGEVTLRPGVRWRVRVVEASRGEAEPDPVPGATLTAVAPAGALRPVTTDDQGDAELEGPAAGALTLEVRASGFAPRRVEMPEEARSLNATPYQVILERGGWIEAEVWDETTSSPCAGCQVTLSGAGPVQVLVTDRSGTARSEPLAPGPWRASLARIQGYGTVVTRSGGDNARTVSVTPGGTVHVRFGDPRETLDVLISPPPPQPAAWRLVVRDASGAFRLYDLDASGSATVRRPAGAAVLALLGAGMTIELGTLRKDADDPTLINRATGLVTARLPSGFEENGAGTGAFRLDLIDLSTGRRVAEIDAQPGAEIRVPFLAGGTYALQGAGRTLATAAVIDGQETDLGDLQ